jgi:ribosome biogenesis protein NSA2
MNKAHVTHPELKATFSLDILGVKKNPNGAMYSSLGVITKGERGQEGFKRKPG